MSVKIAVVGLGYVGLPLAVALSDTYKVTGFDIDLTRVQELKDGFDRTGEIEEARLKQASLAITNQVQELKGFDIYIVTVPTPIDELNKPDLTAVKKASEMVGSLMDKGTIVVYESTVYPGVTEKICGPILENVSGLRCGEDFFLGYSPERINPGDKVHTIDKITKIVAGQTSEITDKLAHIYGSVNQGNIFKARDIKTAEAAKVIENAQRDINIAFMNEVASIFERLDISTYDVLDAAGTKWNFLPFTPGLVGGHCVGVDPFYLAECAKENGVNPDVILSGRRTNDGMGAHIALNIHKRILDLEMCDKKARILVLGLTFKENVPDLRNTKVIDIIKGLEEQGHEVIVHDVLANPQEAFKTYQLELRNDLSEIRARSQQQAVGQSYETSKIQKYDCIVGAVSHEAYKNLTRDDLTTLSKPGGLVVDIKKMWNADQLPDNVNYWTL